MCRTARLIAVLALLTGLARLPGSGLESPLLAAQTTGPEATSAEAVDISGRIAVGLDKVFIKDAQGYCLVQGMDLAPFAGRHIQARAVILRADKDYRTVRLLDYRVASPDDESPAAAKAPAPAKPPRKQ